MALSNLRPARFAVILTVSSVTTDAPAATSAPSPSAAPDASPVAPAPSAPALPLPTINRATGLTPDVTLAPA